MPVSIDNPPVSSTPSTGAGSQTPPTPTPETTPLGGAPAVKPIGTPGAPPSTSPGVPPPAPGAAGKPGAPGQPPAAPAISSEDLNRYKAIQQSLYPDLVKSIDAIKSSDENFNITDATDDQIKDIKDYLLDIGWDATYLSNEILKTNNTEDIKKFFTLVGEYQEKSNKDDLKQFENFISQKDLSVEQQSNSIKTQEKALEQQKLNPIQAPGLTPLAPSNIPGAKPNPSMNTGNSSRPVAIQEKLNQKSSKYNLRGTGMPTGDIVVENGTIKVASQESPTMVAQLFKAIKSAESSIETFKHATILQKGAEVLGESIEAFDADTLRKQVEASVSDLQTKIAEAFNFQKKENDSPTVDGELEKFIGKGKDTVEKGKSLFTKKDDHEKKESPAEEKKEHGPMGDEKKEEKSEEKKPNPFAKKDEAKPAEDKKDIKDILASIKSEVLKTKEAQLYPFKDINKQESYKDINADNAKDASKASTKSLGEIKKEKDKGTMGMNRDKSNSITPVQLDKVKQKVTANAIAKSRLAVELASQQQLKGLIPNPLKVAMVKNMVEAGIEKTAAEAIAHNTMIDGYQDSMSLISKEAFANFVNKDYKDFVKTAEFTLNSGMVESKVETKEAKVGEKSYAIRTASAEAKDEGFTEIIKAHLTKFQEI